MPDELSQLRAENDKLRTRATELEGLLREIKTRLAHAGYCQGVASMTRGDRHMEASYREEVDEIHAKIDAALK